MLRLSWVFQSLLARNSHMEEVKIANPLFVGVDVSRKNNVAYLMKPDDSK